MEHGDIQVQRDPLETNRHAWSAIYSQYQRLALAIETQRWDLTTISQIVPKTEVFVESAIYSTMSGQIVSKATGLLLRDLDSSRPRSGSYPIHRM